jgi:hypothetical protein
MAKQYDDTNRGALFKNDRKEARKIEGQYIPHRLAMIQSPAWRVLSLSARRVLERIEIEHMQHGGKENGQLAVTYDHLVEYGIDRHAIAPAQRELEAPGFAEITEHGCAGHAEHRAPNKFQLTYLHTNTWKPTDEWRRIKTREEAEAIAKMARLPRETPRKTRVQKQKPVGVSAKSRCGRPPLKRPEKGANEGQSPVGVSHTTSISLGESDVSASVTENSWSVSRRARRRRKLPWSKPTLTEVLLGPKTIDHLKALYKHQAEQVGQPDDVWLRPPSPSGRLERAPTEADAQPKLPLGPVIVTRPPAPFKCSGCGEQHDRPGQRYCRSCHTEYSCVAQPAPAVAGRAGPPLLPAKKGRSRGRVVRTYRTMGPSA